MPKGVKLEGSILSSCNIKISNWFHFPTLHSEWTLKWMKGKNKNSPAIFNGVPLIDGSRACAFDKKASVRFNWNEIEEEAYTLKTNETRKKNHKKTVVLRFDCVMSLSEFPNGCENSISMEKMVLLHQFFFNRPSRCM